MFIRTIQGNVYEIDNVTQNERCLIFWDKNEQVKDESSKRIVHIDNLHSISDIHPNA